MHPVYQKLENDLKQAKYALNKCGITDHHLVKKINDVLFEIRDQQEIEVAITKVMKRNGLTLTNRK